MELASGTTTPSTDTKPVIARWKVYWLYENTWDDEWIARYHKEAPSIARQIQSEKTTTDVVIPESFGMTYKDVKSEPYTCEDFALEVLVRFASENLLPVKLKTDAAVFANIDRNYKSEYKPSPPTIRGFLNDVKTAYAAYDMPKNCITLSDKLAVLPGDIFLKHTHSHVQVVVSKSSNEIDILQGNFPSSGADTGLRYVGGHLAKIFLGRPASADSPTSPDYYGVPVQNGSYILNYGKWRYQNLTLNGKLDSGQTWIDMSIPLQWNFMEFNNLP
ncbi:MULTISPECIES: hypothetical protein [Paraburkholderia]|uniref:hypothetical protein n=1 Tax=Paraburkholderia TaxID=1822464 RepID=UPI002257598A|nr:MULTISPECIES: hypothetical protein [Paraburkholderia]MCX4163679.1 hypothetical protein [Paraburkholderia megapolitana]MDN7159174.1 hypothetical protein [Paraburkholderia sp. CHISQ3]MDQ6496221.1 hypothetical protein [Paraburkholderia megapolitana]